MAHLLGVTTANPPHALSSAETKRHLAEIFPRPIASRFSRVVDGTRIASRRTTLPIASLLQLRTREERNEHYRREATRLGEEVVRLALATTGIDPQDVVALIPVSCTGYLMPSLDARLINALGLPATARRLPITELGCSAGAAALGVATELLRGARRGVVLVVSVELCSLCAQLGEPSPSDVMGAVLFADGAACAVVSGDESARGPELVAAGTVLIPGSMECLETRLSDTGLRLNLSPALPRVLRANLRDAVNQFLGPLGLGLPDIRFFAIHPGGPKIIDTVAECFGLSAEKLQPSWDILERFGNMSSATIFFVLDEIWQRSTPREGDLGLVLAFGPGVSCELVLMRWQR